MGPREDLMDLGLLKEGHLADLLEEMMDPELLLEEQMAPELLMEGHLADLLEEQMAPELLMEGHLADPRGGLMDLELL